MAEKISELLKSVENDNSSTQEQKDKAREVLKLLTNKNKQNLLINSEAREDSINILKEVTLNVEISTSMIEDNLASPSIPTASDLEKLPQKEADKKGEDLYKELQRQGWGDAYIVPKLMSLGFLPIVHEMKYSQYESGKSIKWVWNNGKYILAGGPFSNGTLNKPFIEANKAMTNFFVNSFTSEENQLKYILNSVRFVETSAERGFIRERIEKLEALKTAINGGNLAEIKIASDAYGRISEKTGKISDLYKKYGISEKVKSEISYKEKKANQANEEKANQKKARLESKLTKDREKVGIGIAEKIKSTTGDEKLNNLLKGLYRANAEGNNKKAAELIKEYKLNNYITTIPEIKNFETFITTDHVARIEKEVRRNNGNQNLTISEKKDIIKQERTKAIDSELKGLTKEIKAIDDRIYEIKTEAEKKLKELDKVASENPKKVPELRAEIEKLTADMNKEIAKLETVGVEKLKKLNPSELELLKNQSKWTEKFIKANGGIDKLMSGFSGKLVGVGAIALLAKGVYDGTSKDGFFTKETGKNVADIGIGMIPVIGGIYDIGMAIGGKDLNGKEMGNKERWLRAGLGAIGLVPGLGTIVKGLAVVGKGTARATKVAQAGELIVQGGNLTGKVVGIGLLGYGGFTTVTYALPSNN